MDFYVVMGRAGNRISRKKHKGGRVGAPHRVKKEETINWFKKRVRDYCFYKNSPSDFSLIPCYMIFFIVRWYRVEQIEARLGAGFYFGKTRL